MMSFIDGQMILMEGAPVVVDGMMGKGQKSQKAWYADGINVSLYLATKAMDKLLLDAALMA